MNYTELKRDVQNTVENTFTDDQLATFTRVAEVSIYEMAQPPVLRKNVTGSVTAGNAYLTLPADFLYTHSIATIAATGRYTYLTVKDVNFLREAYPNPAATASPKYYAQFDEDSFILGPTPDANYQVELHYGHRPESIVTAFTTWLSENFYPILLNRTLIEAARFLKLEKETIDQYNQQYMESLTLYKNLTDGKLRQDSYRNGQPIKKVG